MPIARSLNLHRCTYGILHRAQPNTNDGRGHGEGQLDIVLDPPGHVHLPIADDAIIDAVGALRGDANMGTALAEVCSAGYADAGD
ncbi:hypothetical protein OH779_00490 [Actinacidiphila glaucinigra]|uniref:hypothetical protein n=1 Tax=Actinacidiphila glaucinigra TaxID=235986 RepID=UPI00386801C6